jgi:AcrR family transcriptional regulator
MTGSERSLILEPRPQELRERILDATLRVIRERGMARTRTSAIAEAAGCAEGSIYRYFSSKPELMVEVVRTRLPDLHGLLRALPARAGTATVRANVLEVAGAAAAFYAEAAPLLAGIVADAELRDGRDELLAWAGLGPGGAADALAAYLRAEQVLGRVRADADPELAARALLSCALGESLAGALVGGDRGLAGLIVRELEPGGSP